MRAIISTVSAIPQPPPIRIVLVDDHALVLAGLRILIESQRGLAVVGEASAREREVLALIGEALSNKRIAERLNITETTVRHHLTSIFGKLGVSDRLELLVYAHRHKLVPPPS